MRAETYAAQLSGDGPISQAGRDYLKSRGLSTRHIAEAYGLGVVAEPLPGDEEYTGRLVLPYWTLDGIRGIKYRCAEAHSCKEHGHPKYTQPHGQSQRIYNAPAYFSGRDYIGVAEGEIDAITATVHLDIPTIGIPGASQWKSSGWHWQLVLRDFSHVIVFGDGDKPGKDLATEICADAGPSGRLVLCPEGHDVNSMFLDGRGDELRRKAGLDGYDGDAEAAELVTA